MLSDLLRIVFSNNDLIMFSKSENVPLFWLSGRQQFSRLINTAVVSVIYYLFLARLAGIEPAPLVSKTRMISISPKAHCVGGDGEIRTHGAR